MKFNKNILDYVGNTPVIKLQRVIDLNIFATIWAKLENLNPSGSIKDRICLSILEDAEQKKEITPGKTTIVEATSGNTGIGLALICSAKGYKLKLVMPDNVSEERKQIIRAYGAEIISVDSTDSLEPTVNIAMELANKNSDYYYFGQFNNPKNTEAHSMNTAEEILEQIPGELDAFVTGVGTGGTITGVGKTLKSKYPNIKIIAVEPESCSVLAGGKPGKHQIQGIGVGFIPEILDKSIFDLIIKVSDDNAIFETNQIIQNEGIMVGISSGASLYASKLIAKELGPNKQIITIFCDTGERYLSTGIFSNVAEYYQS